MTKIYYAILIQTQPTSRFQPYVGWDQVHTDRREAVAARDRARKLWHDAKVITMGADTARQHGWLGDPAEAQ